MRIFDKIHGESTGGKTIEAIHFVKDYAILSGDEDNVPITKGLLKKCTSQGKT